jgi:hypothetical protein
MDSVFVIVIILLVIVIYYNTISKEYYQYMTSVKINAVSNKNEDPLYVNVNLKDICQNLNFKNVEPPVEHIVLPQVNMLKEAVELELKDEEHKPHNKFTNSDLYIVDNKSIQGDDVFTARMMNMAKQSKIASDARSMMTKNSFIPYLEEELEEHANSVWWDDDSLEADF